MNWPQYRDMTDAQMLEWGTSEAAARIRDLELRGPDGLRRAQENAEQRRKAIGATKTQAANLVIAANRAPRRSS